MHEVFASKLITCVILVGGIACGDSHSGSVDASRDSAAPDAHVTTRTFKNTVKDQNTGAPIPGAQVCTTLAGSTCATSAADGTYAIDVSLPDGATRFAETTTAPGRLGRENLYFEILSAQTGYSVFWDEIGGLYAMADAITFLSTQAGFTYPTTTNGFVQILVLDGNAKPVAATATISPPVTGSGPVYFNAAGVPDRKEIDTSAGGQCLLGNLPAGDYAITVQAAGKTCTIMPAGDAGTINGEWPPSGKETLRVAVSANMLTDGLAVQCM